MPFGGSTKRLARLKILEVLSVPIALNSVDGALNMQNSVADACAGH